MTEPNELLHAFADKGFHGECWVARGITSQGSFFLSRQFVGRPNGWRSVEDARQEAERIVALSNQHGGKMTAVYQVLNLVTMCWEDAEEKSQ